MCLPSKVELRHLFPLEHTAAITVHKSQGWTLGNVILALSHKRALKCNMEYSSVSVALSGIRKKENIRLLLTKEPVI
jgi:ATP-dependent exoDNAse (exonuclease V) alpha subunit